VAWSGLVTVNALEATPPLSPGTATTVDNVEEEEEDDDVEEEVCEEETS
jgi:hypothetical protein